MSVPPRPAPRRRTRGLTTTLLLAAASLVALAAAFGPTAQEEAAGPDDPVADLAWMAGTWRAGGEGRFLEEVWSDPIAGDTLMGMFRWARHLGGTWMYELMTIEAEPDGEVVFRLRHFSRKLEPWESEADGVGAYRMVAQQGQEVVFEDATRTHPRQFVYSREGDVLTVMLVGVDADGAPDREHADRFQFQLHAD